MSLSTANRQGKIVAAFICVAIVLFLADTGLKAYAQAQKRTEQEQEESFNRPAPTRPIRPEIPSANRYRQDKVFLEYADSLYKTKSRDTIERQILKGNVKFRQAGMWMFCDSAYYYPEQNSLDAFSNVRMEQGDTLFVYADKLFYNGDERMAFLKNGPTRDKVTLINKDVTLTTDSLDYDLGIDLGWYSKWGTIDDKVNTLTSLYGEYSPATKKADFYTDVVLINNRDGFRMLTDTLHYDTETHIANIESRTEIQSDNDTIITHNAVYYTDNGNADLLTRSLIIHRDSTGNITTLEGDSIIYDSETRISRAYMYRDPMKKSTPMVLTDTAQKTTLIGGFGIYNDSTKEALATIYPLLMEYSQGDTLFLRADTIKTFLITEMIPVKQRRWTASGYPENNGVPIVIIENGHMWIDTTYFSVRLDLAEAPMRMLLNAIPEKPKPEIPIEAIELVEADTVINEIEILEIEETPPEIEIEEKTEEEDLSEKEPEITEIFDFSLIPDSINYFSDSVFISRDSLLLLTDSLRNLSDSILTILPDTVRTSLRFLIETKDSITPDSIPELVIEQEVEEEDTVPKIPYEYHVALAYHRARFFKKDMQGVADSMVFVEKDSMLYMFRKPIIWSGERQVTGNRIDVHFNDSTADWAYLPESGFMSEYVDEDFYNQITGKEITAYFEDQGLKRMSVSGNVETIFLPQESDSTFNRLVRAESSYLELYLKNNEMDWLKMWPEVSGTVTPIFLVKKSQQYLEKFKWWGFLRPEREWYGNQIRWADNLGEVPDELEQYFLAPSDFGEPKSFTGPRIILPPTTLADWDELPALDTDSLILDSDIYDNLNDSTIIQTPDSVMNVMTDSELPDIDASETLEDIDSTDSETNMEEERTEEQTEDIEDQLESEPADLKPEELIEEETEDSVDEKIGQEQPAESEPEQESLLKEEEYE